MALVENLEGLNGNKVLNQFVINLKDGTAFQSYQSVIAFVENNGKVHLSSHWDYSTTTSKYLYKFLREYTKYSSICRKYQVQKLLDNGEFVMDLDWRKLFKTAI